MTTSSSLFSLLPLPVKTVSLPLPPFLYGTAWKKDLTASLVHQALQHGFTAIDTACQPRHYREDLVGEGVRKFLSSQSKLTRRDLFIQTKFTSVHGQDPNNVPYNPKASLAEQVHQSVATSLKNFASADQSANDGNRAGRPYIDSLVLHSPMPSLPETLEVWQVLESYVPDTIRALGISNTNLYTLMDLYGRATIKPSIVQNRFYADTKYDIAVRKFCAENGIVYQSFWTLTANPKLLRSRVVDEVASDMEITKEEALYVLVMGLGGIVVLNGTTNVERMKGDWNAVAKVREAVESKQEKRIWWEARVNGLKKEIGEVVDVVD